eukprot:2068263-Pyramimonas_sp.AAC.1
MRGDAGHADLCGLEATFPHGHCSLASSRLPLPPSVDQKEPVPSRWVSTVSRRFAQYDKRSGLSSQY